MDDHIRLVKKFQVYEARDDYGFSDTMDTVMRKMTKDRLEDIAFCNKVGISPYPKDEPKFTVSQLKNNAYVAKAMEDWEKENEWVKKFAIVEAWANNKGDLPSEFIEPIWEYGVSNGFLFHLYTKDTGTVRVDQIAEAFKTASEGSNDNNASNSTPFNSKALSKAVKDYYNGSRTNPYNCDCQNGGVDAMSIDTDWLQYNSNIILTEVRKLVAAYEEKLKEQNS